MESPPSRLALKSLCSTVTGKAAPALLRAPLVHARYLNDTRST